MGRKDTILSRSSLYRGFYAKLRGKRLFLQPKTAIEGDLAMIIIRKGSSGWIMYEEAKGVSGSVQNETSNVSEK